MSEHEVDLEYKRDGFDDYIIISSENDYPGYELKMLKSADVKYLLPVDASAHEIRYNINGYIDFRTALKRCANKCELIKTVYNSLINLLMNLDDYMLNSERILISPESIHVNGDYSDAAFIYVLGESFDVKDDFISFTEYIMKNLDHRDDEAVLLIYGIYSIVRQEHYEISDVKRYIDEGRTKRLDTVIKDVSVEVTDNITTNHNSDNENSGRIRDEAAISTDRKMNTIKKNGIIKKDCGTRDLTGVVKSVIADKHKLRQAVIVTATVVLVTVFIILDIIS